MAVRAVYDGENWDETQEEISELMDALDLPAGYSWGWNDRIVENQDQNAEMGINFLLAILLVYLVMASLFESLAQPFAILFSIPFAMPGALWLLTVTGTPFNLMAQIGLLILFGIVVNNGIVLIDHVKNIRKAGVSREEAILRGGRERLRPILMTAATTILGLTPMAIGKTSVFGGYYYPLARTVIGGLLASTVLTLVVLPMIYSFMDDVSNWLRRRIMRASEPT